MEKGISNRLFYEEVERRIDYLRDLMDKKNKSLSKAPIGKIVINHHHSGFQYFVRENPKDKTIVSVNFPEITGNRKVAAVAGDICNKKITYASDIEPETDCMNCTRIGFGTDLHRLAEGRKFFLGGIEIPAEKGEVAHSDGDVLLHAIMDALLGAAALGDIGKHFPDTDPAYLGADSLMLLRHVTALLKGKGYRIGNIDSTACSARAFSWSFSESLADATDATPHKHIKTTVFIAFILFSSTCRFSSCRKCGRAPAPNRASPPPSAPPSSRR